MNDLEVKEETPLYYLSKYRAELMGVMILWIVWFHSDMHSHTPFIEYIKELGYGAVDVFFLVSGIGVYFSLSRNTVTKYVKNRLLRILPVWWSYLLVCVILGETLYDSKMSLREIMGFFTFTGFWQGFEHQGNWYVYVIMFFYLLAPLFYFLIKEGGKYRGLLILGTIVIITFSFFHNYDMLRAFTRLPDFVIGMCIAHRGGRKLKRINWIYVLVAFVGSNVILRLVGEYAASYLGHYGLWWYPFILIAPFLALLICKVLDIVNSKAPLALKPLRVFGESSLEIFLVSEIFLSDDTKKYFRFFENYPRRNALMLSVASIVVAVLFHFLLEKVKLHSIPQS